MTTEIRTRTLSARRAGAIVVDLPQPVMAALIRLAVREDRDIIGQARRMIADGLAAEGLLSTPERTQ